MSLHSRRAAIALAASMAAALSTPARAATRHTLQSPLARALTTRRFVTYQPTGIKAFNGVLTHTDEVTIKADLAVLRPRFDGLVTYGALNGAERIADVAAALGFRAVIVGAWDAFNAGEIQNAIAAWRRNPGLVVGCAIGNETMLAGHGRWNDLAHAIAQARAIAPGLPLATTEPFAQYLDHPEAVTVLRAMDFMLVNIHPIFEPWFRTAKAANWADFVARACDRLGGIFRGPILVKETGVPSGPKTSGYDETMQADFWRALEARMPRSQHRAFSYFSAFDAAWRAYDATPVSGPRPEEAHWGLFTEQRAAKPVVSSIPLLPDGSKG